MKSPVVCLGAERQPSDARDADGCEPCLHRSRARRAEDVVRSLRCPRGIHRGRVLTDNDMGTVPIQFFFRHLAVARRQGFVRTLWPARVPAVSARTHLAGRPRHVLTPCLFRRSRGCPSDTISNDKTGPHHLRPPRTSRAHVALTEPLARSISSPDRPHSSAHTCHPHRAAPARVIS